MRVYGETNDVESIDAFTGGAAETIIEEGLVGPTFACIIGKQFNELRFGDRFFFNNNLGGNDGARGLKPNTLATVRRRRLRDIMCENTEVRKLAENIMKIPNARNPQRACNQGLNQLNFEAIAADISDIPKPDISGKV